MRMPKHWHNDGGYSLGQRVMKRYQDALRDGRKAGAVHAQGDALLAMTCAALAGIHAIVPALVFHGARRRGLDSSALLRLSETDPVALGDLMFVED